jgi:ATP-dependent Clp protease ATP-binding subunit ClpA
MFERFTHEARATVVAAQREARLGNTHHIGTEHLLMGMLEPGEGRAYDALHRAGITLEYVRSETVRVLGATAGLLGEEDAAALKSIGIDLDAVVESVERSFGPGALSPTNRKPAGHIPFTKSAKTVLELGLREALRLDHDYIGTEHLLLGLIRQGDGVAMKVLMNSGIDVTAMRDALIADLHVLPTEPKRRMGIFSPSGRFTPAARDAVLRAGEEAYRMNLHYVGTEHILLALADSGTGTAYTALASAGVTAERVRLAISARKPSLTGHFTDWRKNRGRPHLTSHATAVVESASREAVQLGRNYVGTEHLLLAITGERQGLAAEILRKAGVSLDEMRTSLISELGEAA